MSSLPFWRRYARIRGPNVEADVEEELRFHLESRTQDLIARGRDPESARAEAERRFGDLRRVRRECEAVGRGALRSAHRRDWWDGLIHDLRHVAKGLRRSPGFATVAILTIGVAIGATTAIFSVVDGVLLRPLSYPDAGELVTVRLGVRLDDREDISFSDRGFSYFHDRARSFERFGGYVTTQLALVGMEGDPERIPSAGLTHDAFEALGVRPLLGRLPAEEQTAEGAPIGVLLGESLWTNRFGGDSAIVGRVLDLGGRPAEVIGVMPASFEFPSPATELWYAYRVNPASTNWEGHYLQVVARLRDGVSLDAAGIEATALIGTLGEAGYTAEWTNDILTGRATIRTLADGIVGASRRPLYIVLGTVGIVLLIACGNVASLLLARAEARAREVAVRTALGASRGRIVRDVLLESLVIAVAGGILGLLIAQAGTRALVDLAPSAIPRLDQIRINDTVLMFLLALVIGTAALVGILPGLRAASGGWIATLRDAGRTTTPGRAMFRARGLLVASQVALTVVLLVGSGLLLRTFRELSRVDPGFRPDGVLTFNLSLPGNSPEESAAFMVELSERLEAIPGVEAASGSTQLPLTEGGAITETIIEDAPPPAGTPTPTFTLQRVAPGYFETMGISLVSGRTFDRADHEQRLGTAIVSSSLADDYWPRGEAVGKRIRQGTRVATVVGVVGDVRDGSLTTPAERIVYLPMLDAVGGGVRSIWITVRGASDVAPPLPAIRREVAAMDPRIPISDVRMLREIVDASMGRVTFTMTLLMIAASAALFLGSVGVYGVISWTISQRTAELGIRRALGAERRQVWALMMRQSLAMTLLGAGVGLVAAVALRRTLATLVHGVELLDPLSFLGAAGVIVSVAVAATLIPAARATRVQPAAALREH